MEKHAPFPAFAGCLLCVLLSGCTATFREPRLAGGESHSEWTPSYVFGLFGRAEIDVRDHCPSGRVREIETGANVATIGISLLTIGIYTPRRVVVTCEAVPAR